MSGRRVQAWALRLCAVLPAVGFLAPAWTPGRLGGQEEGGAYLALHALGGLGGAMPAAFPGLDRSVPVAVGGWGLLPLSPSTTLDLAGAVGLLGGALLWQAWAMRALATRPAASRWVGVVVAWVATMGAAGLCALADGRPWAAQAWAPVALLLIEGPAALLAGVALGALAAPMLPAAALLLLAEARVAGGEARAQGWRVAGWLAGAGVAWGAGLARGGAPTVAPGAWLAGGVGFVGVLPLLLAGWALARGDTPARVRGGAALAGVAATLVPGVGVALLSVVPPLAVLAGGAALGGAALVLLGSLAVVEGVRGAGVGGRVPTVDAAPAPPEALLRAPGGPVLDLPLARGPARRALAMQLAHGRPVAVDRTGTPVPEAFDAARALAVGGCPAVWELGYAVVVVRREAELRSIAPVQACLGAPFADDGVTAVWTSPAATGVAGGARDP